MSIIKKPYEISLWEDILTFVVRNKDGVEESYEGSIPENATGQVIAQYYKERKICIIGSDTMNTPIRAVSSKLVSKINGENILTFDMYSHYCAENGEYYENPFIKLLINERKVKLRYGELGKEDTKWYDFIIKNISENSSNKTYSYTAKDLFINELSKSGFSLEFDAELENNTGTVEELAEVILEESDWQLKSTGLKLRQTVEEPLYAVKLNKDIKALDMESRKTLDITSGKTIYCFYNNIINKDPFLQFLYIEDDKYEIDENQVITNSVNWYIEGIGYDDNNKPDIASSMGFSSDYRGKRLVRKVKTIYDATIDKYVNVYTVGEGTNKKEVCGYTETEYISPAAVRSYITNSSDFDSDIGWEVGAVNGEFPEMSVVSVPDIRGVNYSNIENTKFASCLKVNFTKKGQTLYNSGIIDYRHYINGFTEGEKYVFRVKCGTAAASDNYGATSLKYNGLDGQITCSVREYKLSDGAYNFVANGLYFQATLNKVENEDYYQAIVECKKSLSYAEMTKMSNSLGFFIEVSNTPTIYFENVQFFQYIDNGEGPLSPEEIKLGEIKTRYLYYIRSDEYKSIEDVEFVYKGYEPSKEYSEVYNSEDGYEKKRSITASESNRFNLIQELCEIFECWAKFEIEHNEDGSIKLIDYVPQKWVSFHEYIGKDNYAGFKYGINLKSIQRTIDSDAIVSKLIVKDNANEFATDGFCSVARASENPSGENFILDFNYYIRQGLIGLSEITNDLYLTTNGYLGYYKELKRINNQRDILIKEQSGLFTDIAEYSALVQTYTVSVAEAEKLIADKLVFIQTFTGYSFEQLMSDKQNEWWESDQVNSYITSIGRLKSVSATHGKLLETAQENLKNAQDRYDEINIILTSRKSNDSLLLQKEELHRTFYKKYSRFLQEGSWISEDYVDDNLYFLDAQSTLHTSAQPKITYNISVLELSRLEGYENYSFALGDKTTIEDTEFFGWTWSSKGIKTPYKEEIVVTELTIMLDSPETNQIKVQNYKTQFEDLFQRMAATTQSVEYSTGQYQKVSGIIQQDGTINITTLQNSIANNAITLQNAKDQSVVWDETGITTTSLNNPSEIVRIVSGGIFLSVDGGITWNTGITGKGINASYITSGKLNVEEVNILNGSFPSFRWDNTGISAYEFTTNENTGKVENFNFSKFVRLDQYGLYGLDGYSNFDSSIREEDGLVGEDKIWKYSNFALTWKGFQIKSTAKNGGYISITSDNDLQVFSGPGKERVKLGYLREDQGEAIYGLSLIDGDGNLVMTHGSDGRVWIQNELQIGSGINSMVNIGYLENTKFTTKKDLDIVYSESDSELKEIHQVFNAGNNFIVHEDGSMVATDGYFRGIIYATGGKIGNMEIEALGSDYEVAILVQDNAGTVFEPGEESKTLIAVLYKDGNVVNDNNLQYQWYKNNAPIINANTNTLIVLEADISSSSEFSCKITKE